MVLGAKTEAVHALCASDNLVYYKLTFQGNFNATSSPGGLPSLSFVGFTQVVWVTHNSQVEFWKPGAMASSGVEHLAEIGETFTFTDEIIAARANIAAYDIFPPGRYLGGEETISKTIRLCEEAPLFTFLSMLDLTPDWFIGLSGYSLLDGQGNWIPSRTVNLYPYDAGTEEGTEYSFNNPPTIPHQPIASIKGQGKFSGSTVPVAKMKFELANPVNLSVGSKSSVRVTEGDNALRITATLTRSNTSGSALSIPIGVRGSGTTAEAGDYTVGSSISIADNSSSGTAAFAVTEDSNDEPDKKVVVELGNPLPGAVTAGAVKAVTITIVDNDATEVSLGRSDAGVIAEGGAGAKENAEFTVTLSRALAAGERIDVPLVLSGAGITADDVGSLSRKSGESLNTGVTVAGSGTLTPTVVFQGAGARTATLVLTPGDDDYIESDETLTVALGPDGTGANGFDRSELRTNVGGGADPHSSSRSFDVVIESEDVNAATLPVVSISGGSAVTEGGTAIFTLSASPAPASSISVKVNLSQSGSFAQNGQIGLRSVVVGTGGTESFTVKTVDDGADEKDGSVVATLAKGAGYSIGSPDSASVAVKDNDIPVVSISGGSAVTEGGTAIFTLSASPAPASSISVKVNLSQSGSFAQNGQIGLRSVVVGTGGTESFTVKTVDDGADEKDGSVVATLAKGAGYSIGSPDSASVAVKDNDIPVVSISGSSAVTEGDDATFTLSASPAPASSISVKVNLSQSGSFAQNGQVGLRSVTIGTGGTGSFTVTTADDSTNEPDGSVVATLAKGAGYSIGSPDSASVAVKDNDIPVVSISGGSAVTEGGVASFTLSASPAPASDISVKVNLGESGSFAQNGQVGSRSVTIGTGGTGSFTVTTADDSTNEPDGSVVATLAKGAGYSIGSPDSASVAVKDNDIPVVSISGGSAVTEGGTAIFTLSASPAPASSISVRVGVQSGSFAQSGQWSVTIRPSGTGSFPVTTTDDGTDEPDGFVVANILSTGQAYSVSPDHYSASVAVNDNDGPPPADDDSPPPAVVGSGHSNNEPSPDRGALVAIYNATAGGGWIRKDNWNTRVPVTIWYGVVADLEGRITGLILENNNLEGRIHEDIGELEMLKVLYMNNNGLEGAVPLEQLGGLESLEELALWGNEGLGGTIPDELGKRVDRAVLRKIKEINGVSVLTDWFTGGEAVFDYSGSGWSEVEVNGNDRVSGLDLSGIGLRGDITEAIWEFSALEELDLSDNPDLSGEIPLAVMNGGLEFLDISGSGVCVPQDEEFVQWLESIDFTDNENCGGNETATLSTSEPVPAQKPVPVRINESAQGSGGGCSIASGSGFKRSVPGFAPAVSVLLIIFLAGRRDAQRENCIGVK